MSTQPSVLGADVRETVHAAARRARTAARTLATLTAADKNRALHAAADAVLGMSTGSWPPTQQT